MNFFREFLIGLSFYTRLPIQLQNVTEDEFYNSMLLMPVIGVVIGAALWGFGWCVSWIGIPELAAILMLIFYIWLTGGLHYDGVADTIDAVFSARDHEKMMTIMKDSRLGSFGAISLILLMLTMWVGYRYTIDSQFLAALWLMPVGFRTNSMAVGTRDARIPASCPAAVGRVGALIDAAPSDDRSRSLSEASKSTTGVKLSRVTVRSTPWPAAASSAIRCRSSTRRTTASTASRP